MLQTLLKQCWKERWFLLHFRTANTTRAVSRGLGGKNTSWNRSLKWRAMLGQVSYFSLPVGPPPPPPFSWQVTCTIFTPGENDWFLKYNRTEIHFNRSEKGNENTFVWPFGRTLHEYCGCFSFVGYGDEWSWREESVHRSMMFTGSYRLRPRERWLSPGHLWSKRWMACTTSNTFI